jgi:hypothetical protein
MKDKINSHFQSFLNIFFVVLFISLFFSGKAMAATFTNDTFTGTVGTSLGTHVGETGAAWTATQGTALIDSSGRLRGNDAGIARYYSSGVPSSADYDVDWDIHVNTNPGGTFIVSALARANTVQRYNYQVSYNYLGAGLWSLYRYDGSGATLLGSWQGAAVPGATYHGKITLRGGGY